ncbi:MAG TPA: hydrogenase expression/formation protein HypE [Sediminibacterium sp.]|nr:hydrogenase expression/formation protein HypE [Sediminibacterium sp.]
MSATIFPDCPLPVTPTDIITMGHGSGGLLTHRLLQSGVFTMLQNEIADQQHDGAFLELHGRMAFSTDSYVISPLFFPGGNIGELAVNGTVNDLAMCGANAQYLSLSFILEEGFALSAFHQILASIRDACIKAGVQVVTGDTKVVERGKGDGIFINTSGIGKVHPHAQIHHKNIRPGDKIILSGYLAQHGIAIMSKREGLAFESDILSDTAPLNRLVNAMLDEAGEAVHFLRDPTRGGLASVLNELAESCPLGFIIDQEQLPVNAQVEGACEMLGLDPLYVANEGLLIAIAAPESADTLLTAMRATETGKHAVIIGEVTASHAGKVYLKSRIGGHRIVGFLTGEQLPRIC